MLDKIEPINGWVLITRVEVGGPFGPDKKGSWYICWHEIFDTKTEAIEFATKSNWYKPFRAVRASLTCRK